MKNVKDSASYEPLPGGGDADPDAVPICSTASRRVAKGFSQLELVHALEVRDQDEVIWILKRLAEKRTDITLSVDKIARLEHNGKTSEWSVVPGTTGDDSSMSTTELPTIQFARMEFHAFTQDDSVKLYITRSGNKDGRSEVKLETSDLTAHAGSDYSQFTDTIFFEPGEGSKEVGVPILHADTWEAILDFTVGLKPDSVKGAKLARQLSTAKVKIIGTQTFPAHHLKDTLEKDAHLEEQGNKIKFYIAFMSLLLSERSIRCGALKRCLQGQLNNTNFILTQFISVFTINSIFKHGDKDFEMRGLGRHHWLVVIVIIQVISISVLHLMDYVKLTWSVGGPGRRLIQKGILRRYMYFDTISRGEVSDTQLAKAVTQNCNAVVGSISHIIALANVGGGLLSLLVFKLTSPLVFKSAGEHFSLVELSPFIVYPIALGFYIHGRASRTTAALDKVQSAKDKMLDYIFQAVTNFPVLNDFHRRQRCVDELDPLISDYNAASRFKNQIVTNNTYFPHWLSTLFIAFWYLHFGKAVVEDALSLGFFIADLKVIEKFGKEFEELYKVLMEMESTFPDLVKVVILLNKPVDVDDRVEYERRIMAKTEIFRKEHSQQGQGALDRIPIYAKDLKFTIGRDFNFKGKLEVAQGHMVCFVGKHGYGKSTLLKVISGTIFPNLEDGEVFFPSHLRVLHVSFHAQFLRKPFWDNMVLGTEIEHDRQRERVEKILVRLGLDDQVAWLDSDDSVTWQSILTVQEATMLNLARALIANPHVLCIHKPTVAKAEMCATIVMRMLREFVDLRGIEQDRSTVSQSSTARSVSSSQSNTARRPRTVLYTSISHQSAKHADRIYQISKWSVQRVKYEDMDEGLFG